MRLAAGKTRVAKHSDVLCKRVGVPGRRRAQHHQAEGRSRRRGDTIRVRDELECHCLPARFQRRMHFAEQSLASDRIEMMQEIGQQDQIIAAAKIGLEGATRVLALQ